MESGGLLDCDDSPAMPLPGYRPVVVQRSQPHSCGTSGLLSAPLGFVGCLSRLNFWLRVSRACSGASWFPGFCSLPVRRPPSLPFSLSSVRPATFALLISLRLWLPWLKSLPTLPSVSLGNWLARHG